MSAPLCLPADVIAIGFSADRQKTWMEAMLAVVRMPGKTDNRYLLILRGLPIELQEKIICAGLGRDWEPIEPKSPMVRWASQEKIHETSS